MLAIRSMLVVCRRGCRLDGPSPGDHDVESDASAGKSATILSSAKKQARAASKDRDRKPAGE